MFIKLSSINGLIDISGNIIQENIDPFLQIPGWLCHIEPPLEKLNEMLQ
jgi:hypothetical protein